MLRQMYYDRLGRHLSLQKAGYDDTDYATASSAFTGRFPAFSNDQKEPSGKACSICTYIRAPATANAWRVGLHIKGQANQRLATLILL